jgi:hypothetical protein
VQISPPAKKTFGLFNVSDGQPRLSGVAVFGLSVSRVVLERALPDLEANVAALECSRFVLLDECPGNTESWFLARCFDELLVSDVRGVVSFADPVARRTSTGQVIAVGHMGQFTKHRMRLTRGGPRSARSNCCPTGPSLIVEYARVPLERSQSEKPHLSRSMMVPSGLYPSCGISAVTRVICE